MEATDIAQFTAALASADLEHLEHLSPGDLCEILTALELAKNAAAAAQARATVAAADSLRGQAIADGVAAERADKGIPQQLGLARRESPSRRRGTSGSPGPSSARCRTRMRP